MDRRREYLEERLKEAEAKIRAQNQVIRNLELCKDQYDSIMENMSEFVERSDPNFYLTYANKSLAAFYGATPEEMLNTVPGMKDEMRRPMMFLVSAQKEK